MPRRNRVDPWGDLHAVSERGLFTGNRGCLVDDTHEMVRHHRGSLWIICLTEFRGWRNPLAKVGRWTPLFFLDDAVALAAGHRPCGLCRRDAYEQYRMAAGVGGATELNRRLAGERLARGRGMSRAADRKRWPAPLDDLPVGTVFAGPADRAMLVTAQHVRPFSFAGWGAPSLRPAGVSVEVLTPPTSVAALRGGFTPTLHPSAEATGRPPRS